VAGLCLALCLGSGLALTGWRANAQTVSPSQATQALVPAQSEITFVARQLGVPLDGRFKRFEAQLAFDPKQVARSHIALGIDLGSVSMNPDADVELVKPEWFNAGKFPKASFQSSAIKALGAGRYEVRGQLTIKGKAQALLVPVQLSQSKGLTTATGAFALKRLDFKVGDGEWSDVSLVGNEVQVRFKLTFTGVPPL